MARVPSTGAGPCVNPPTLVAARRVVYADAMILLTGGAGFIGSNLLRHLEAEGAGDVAVVDRLRADGKWRNLRDRAPADIIDPDALDAWLADNRDRLTAIFHLGAISATTATDADLVVATNFRLTVRLWREATMLGVPFLYASSAATYGDGALGFVDSADPADLARLRPLNLYGWSKLLTDRRLVALAGRGSAPPAWWGCRFFNVFGPNEGHKGDMASVVGKLAPGLIAGEPLRLFKSYRPEMPDGGQMRDFVWVDDVCRMMLWLWRAGAPSGIYNMGSGVARSFIDLGRAMFAALGLPERITFVDMPEPLRRHYQYFTQADMGRLRRAGWPGQATALEAAVHAYVTGHLRPDTSPVPE
jgi:ADP-L-glycero-D-manno-heptose 6-epimerase